MILESNSNVKQTKLVKKALKLTVPGAYKVINHPVNVGDNYAFCQVYFTTKYQLSKMGGVEIHQLLYFQREREK